MSSFEERKPGESRFETKHYPNPNKEDLINIGKSVFIKGELTGDEDLTIEGRVEGRIELKAHNLVIGPNGKIKAEINAKNVIIIGNVVGNVCAEELVEVKSSGSVVGTITSSRISVLDGAHVKGRIDLQRKSDHVKKSDSSKAEPFRIGQIQPTLPETQVN
jgi:cytoskeletal protein CcmA (bactofilin family)